MTDEQLVKLFQSGDKAAGEQLLVSYKSKVLKIARRFFLAGGETEDLVQEGMCGLYSAMVNYAGGQFSAYADACIRNRIADAVKASSNFKNLALNNFVPIEYDSSPSQEQNPELLLISDEGVKEFYGKMKTCLSAFEYSIFCAYLDGQSLSEIAEATGEAYKSVDNAVTRAKGKLKKLFTAEE